VDVCICKGQGASVYVILLFTALVFGKGLSQMIMSKECVKRARRLNSKNSRLYNMRLCSLHAFVYTYIHIHMHADFFLYIHTYTHAC